MENEIWQNRRESANLKKSLAGRMSTFYSDSFLRREADYYSQIASLAEAMRISAINENQCISQHPDDLLCQET